MVHTLTTSEVVDLLLSDEHADWSPAGARVLVEYLEGIEADTGQPVEFDRVAIRCDYSEYATACHAAGELLGGLWWDPAAAVAALERQTVVLGIPGGGVIVQAF